MSLTILGNRRKESKCPPIICHPPPPPHCHWSALRCGQRLWRALRSGWRSPLASVALASFLVALTPAIPAAGQGVVQCGLGSVAVDGTAATKTGNTWKASAGADAFTVSLDWFNKRGRLLHIELHPWVNGNESTIKQSFSGDSFTFDVAAHEAKLRSAPPILSIRHQGVKKHYRHADQMILSSRIVNASTRIRAANASEIEKGESAKRSSEAWRASETYTFPVTFKVRIAQGLHDSRCELWGLEYIEVSDSRTLQTSSLTPKGTFQETNQDTGTVQAPTTTAPTTTTTPPSTTAAPYSPTNYPPQPPPSQQSDTTTQAEPADDEDETEDNGVTLTAVLQAAKAYKEGNLSLEELQKIIRAYLSS